MVTESNEQYAQNMGVYPNPSNGIFMVDLGTKEKSKSMVTIYNYLGQIVFQQNNSGERMKIDLSEQDKGMYFADLTSGNTQQVFKIVLQ